jgi:hypothetical protein
VDASLMSIQVWSHGDAALNHLACFLLAEFSSRSCRGVPSHH